MKSVEAIFDSHWTALYAVKILKEAGYPTDQLSILGQMAPVEKQKNKRQEPSAENKNKCSGIVLETLMDALNVAGIFEVPGCGYLFGAGAVKKAIDSSVTGATGGGIMNILTQVGVKKETVSRYQQQINSGHFLLVAQGDANEIEQAKNVLCECRKHPSKYID